MAGKASRWIVHAVENGLPKRLGTLRARDEAVALRTALETYPRAKDVSVRREGSGGR